MTDQTESTGEIVHVGQHDVRGVYLGFCSCGWEGADIFGHCEQAIYGHSCDHHESLYGRCTACGMTWEQQAAVPNGGPSDG